MTKPPATTGGTTRQNDGAGNGLGIGVNGDPSPTLTAGDRHCVAISVENHPQDSRVKLSADGTVQTLSGQMGTGGGNVPLILQERFACGCGQDVPEEVKEL